MQRLRTFSIVLLAGFWFCLIGSAEAQQYVAPYRPATPTISPYLDLLRRDRGPLPNYYTYVRPQLEAQQMFRQQGARLQQQGMEIQNLRQNVTQLQMTPGGVAPTGTGGHFLDYSHYYGSGGSTPRSASRAGAASRSVGGGYGTAGQGSYGTAGRGSYGTAGRGAYGRP